MKVHRTMGWAWECSGGSNGVLWDRESGGADGYIWLERIGPVWGNPRQRVQGQEWGTVSQGVGGSTRRIWGRRLERLRAGNDWRRASRQP